MNLYIKNSNNRNWRDAAIQYEPPCLIPWKIVIRKNTTKINPTRTDTKNGGPVMSFAPRGV
ncbi:MAG TPA: hypothetical protein PKV73_08675 [Agriterribacter sp.]|nr:hypothetical protein [Chitinophagaceae bacterium]HRP31952.1 hypothetical protein [Agriterribacter sp.]